jgi:hypothetical protein
MTRPYAALFAVAIVMALALSALGRRPHHQAASVVRHSQAPEVALQVEITADGVKPERVSVPKDHRVRLTISRPSGRPVTVGLAGYRDRISLDSLAAGETRVLEFVADRPGEDFTWLINGQPSGRFVVTGSHLVGDHR